MIILELLWYLVRQCSVKNYVTNQKTSLQVHIDYMYIHEECMINSRMAKHIDIENLMFVVCVYA